MKRATVVFSLMLLIAASFFLLLPADRGLGQKLCWAPHVLKDRARTLLAPIPVPRPEGAGDTASAAEGAGDTASAAEGATRVPVLMYHAVVPARENPDPNNGSIITREAFEGHMAYLYEQGYYTASLEELELFVHGKLRLPEKTVVLTFDDGYENNAVHAYPVLERYGFRASLFVIGGLLREDGEAAKPGRMAYLTKGQLADIASVFDYHSHTHNLHYKRTGPCAKDIPATADPDAFAADIAAIKAMGFDSPYFAYPYGYHSHAMVRTLIDHGYRMAFTVRGGFVEPGDHPMFLPRLGPRSDTDLAALLNDSP